MPEVPCVFRPTTVLSYSSERRNSASDSHVLTAQILATHKCIETHEYNPYNAKDNAIVANILNQFRDIKPIFILALRNFKEFTLTSNCNFFPVITDLHFQ